MAISSNTLFHFTKSADFLKSILKHEFQPRYCLEKLSIGKETHELAIPMICFCDIPLSQIKNHVNTYGFYGIGMTKKWAQEKLLNPILYLRDESELSLIIESIFDAVLDVDNEIDTNNPIVTAALEFIRYLKPYQGNSLRGVELSKDIRFYDEREWRHIPDWAGKIKIWLHKDEYDNIIIRAQENEKIKDLSLKFEPEDISYIIVKEENEIFPMIEALKEIKGKYDKQTIEILNSRIITCEQIFNDF